LSPVSLFRIVVEGEPISKSNATMSRFNWKTKKSEVYVPEKFLDYEKLITQQIDEYLNNFPGIQRPLFKLGPVQMNIHYFLGTKRRKDLPNLPKTTCDALTGQVYTDDAQIVAMSLYKHYDNNAPRVVIEVLPIYDQVEYPIPNTLIENPIATPKKAKPKKTEDATTKNKNSSKPRKKSNK
jgi:Holliday junction resolvase RusA-like endonuclease